MSSALVVQQELLRHILYLLVARMVLWCSCIVLLGRVAALPAAALVL
jgi:hypothetical protein